MTNEQIGSLLAGQRKYYKSGATIPVKFRIEQLKKLYAAIKKYQEEIHEALFCDLGKSSYEGFMCESGLVLSEISYMIRHAKNFARRKTVYTPLPQFASHSFVQPVPYGNVLIMSPWNYPFLLAMDPLTDAIAAGNTAIVKPSAYSPATSRIIEKIIAECFDPEYVAVVTGGRAENAALLEQKFDFVFFTGSQAVGKEVLRHTAEHLTPTVLELGGKSPCIVDASADIRLAAKRIVFGKFLNCGQTCVAPDYVLCDSSVRDSFVAEVAAVVEGFQARNGYTTCLWHNLLTCKILYDRDGRLTAARERFTVPYPEQLQENIVFRNYKLLQSAMPAYRTQISKALRRKDLVSMNHRVTAFLESYFDILFALNEQTHPGEKRLMLLCRESCTILPEDFEENLTRLLTHAQTEPEQICDDLNRILTALSKIL